MERPKDLPEFSKPPVNEVVVGVQFTRLPVTGLHIGRFWSTLADQFPNAEEQTPLEPITEALTPRAAVPRLQLSLIESQHSRHWMISADQSLIIQVQADRFLFNWRLRPGAGEYPRFKFIHERFRDLLGRWRQFVEADLQLGTMHFTGWEVSYINRIAETSNPAELDGVFRFVTPDLPRALGGAPDSAVFEIEKLLRLSAEENPWGRGIVAARNGLGPNRQPMMFLELTVRGPQPPGDNSLEQLFQRHHQAREWIVRTFAALTTDRQHQIWERR